MTGWLRGASVAPEVYDLRPDYAVVLLTAYGLRGGPSDDASEAVLAAAESGVAGAAGPGTAGVTGEDAPHVLQWREAFRGFGAKPQKTRPSVDALLRRVPAGLPRIDRITDVYNAVSVSFAVPVGGEDLGAYVGPPQLVRSDGTEPFDTTAGGLPVVEHPTAGEVVWRDDAGVTCRRWNWRQCTRTRITHATTAGGFILDGLSALGPTGLAAAADALEAALLATNPGATFGRRQLSGPGRH